MGEPAGRPEAPPLIERPAVSSRPRGRRRNKKIGTPLQSDVEDDAASVATESSPYQTAGTTINPQEGDTRPLILAALKKNVVDTREQYHNPDPLARLVGRRNEGTVNINGIPVTALLDTGAEISTVSAKWCMDNGLQIFPLQAALDLRGAGNHLITHHGVVDVTLTAPHVPSYRENTMLLAIDHCPYHDFVPITVGTMSLENIAKHQKEGQPLSEAWKLASTAMQLAQAHQGVPKFDLQQVRGDVRLVKKVTVPPGQTIRTKGKTPVTVHCQRIHVVTGSAAVEGRSWNPVPAYCSMKAFSPKVDVVINNSSSSPLVLPRGAIVSEVHAANSLPPNLVERYYDPTMPLPDYEREGEPTPLPKRTLTEEQEKEFFSKLNLGALSTWEPRLQARAKEILVRHENVFSRDELDHGATSVLRHDIVLKDPTPFRERFRRIPPHLYEEVREHIDEMLRMGAIRKSNSSWASAIVLARRKNGKLRFCIDLRKLNQKTVKDAYSLPRIEETLDLLRGSVFFSALDLKAGYWQVELTDRAKKYTAFTAGPMGFFECVKMPFGLTNAPATFQRLMESCLGELHLTSCLVYLDDVIIFSRTADEHLDKLEATLKRLEKSGLKLKTEKCMLFQVRLGSSDMLSPRMA